MSKSPKYSDWREARRFRALALVNRGWTQADAADAVGVTAGAVSQWMKVAREGGEEALRSKPRLGPEPRLSDEDLDKLRTLLLEGAELHGFRGDVWTQARIAELIWRTFSVQYDPSQIGRIMRRMGWSVQRPVRRAVQRDEAAIKRWKDERWPALKKGRKSKGRRSSS